MDKTPQEALQIKKINDTINGPSQNFASNNK